MRVCMWTIETEIIVMFMRDYAISLILNGLFM